VKVRDVLKKLEENGWSVVRTRGSHRQLKHATKLGTITVAGKPNVDVPIGTLKSIWKQAQIQE
jgi:predicted RNA binding protein YcfA (HicA-like mRNA interferase family)